MTLARHYLLAVTDSSHVLAVRAAYDAVAVRYAEMLRHELDGKPVDRAVLSLFVDLVGAGSLVADLGCVPAE